MGSLSPGRVENGKDQMPEEATVTKDEDAMLRSSFLISVAGQQIF